MILRRSLVYNGSRVQEDRGTSIPADNIKLD